MENVVSIGDLHLGKRIFFVRNEELSSKGEDLDFLWSYQTFLSVKDLVVQNLKISESSIFIFLGDIFDFYSVDKKYLNLFKEIINFILSSSKKAKIIILRGNHDIKSYKNRNITPLKDFIQRRVQYISENKIFSFGSKQFIFAPYVPQKNLRESLSEIIGFEKKRTEDILFFSHCHLYINSIFHNKKMITYEQIRKCYSRPIFIFNGHIHKQHYEYGISQTGSFSPTSYKNYFFSSGAVNFQKEPGFIFPNKKIFLLNTKFFNREALINLLEQGRKEKSVFFLKGNTEFIVELQRKKYQKEIRGIS